MRYDPVEMSKESPITWTAIDPGTEMSHVVVWSKGKILAARTVSNRILLRELREIVDPGENVLLIESMSSQGFKHTGAETFETCYWIGRFIEAAGGNVALVRRHKIKGWHTGKPASKDSDVAAAIKEKYGEKGTKKNPGLTYNLRGDQWQAFALATYGAEGGEIDFIDPHWEVDGRMAYAKAKDGRKTNKHAAGKTGTG